MSRLRILGFFLAAAIGFQIAGVSGAEQYEALSANRERLYIADGRNGMLKVFDLRNGPVPVATVMTPTRAPVRGLRLDERRNRLWVMVADSVFAFDARSLAPLERLALPTNTGPQRLLDLDPDGAPVLVFAGGRRRLSA